MLVCLKFLKWHHIDYFIKPVHPVIDYEEIDLRIAHFGTFDVENYGDLLFPLLLERRLKGISDSITHVSPVGGNPVWRDTVPTISTANALEHPADFDAVIIGGGHLIHAVHNPNLAYRRNGITRFTAYPGLWLGAAYLAAQAAIPLVWNGPGVMVPFSDRLSEVLRWTAEVSDYIALRSPSAIEMFRHAGITTEIEWIPDTAWELDQLWDKAELARLYNELWSSQGQAVPDHSVVFNVKNMDYRETPQEIAGRVDRICELIHARPILLAIGPLDDQPQQNMRDFIQTPGLLIKRPSSLAEVTACLANASGYFGSSFHGMVAAAVFGHPGIMVVPDGNTHRKIKCQELLTGYKLEISLCATWTEAQAHASDLFAMPTALWKQIADDAKPRLDTHWARVIKTLTHPDITRQQKKTMHLAELAKINQRYAPHLGLYSAILAEQLDSISQEIDLQRQKLTSLRKA